MAIYTVHVPEAASDLVTQADRTVFIREGFSARAFLFGLPYLLWHRVWIASIVWAILIVVLAALWFVLRPPAFLLVALFGLMHLYLGAEGPDLARWSLARRGFPMRDLVSATGLSEAEALFFSRQTASTAVPARAVARSGAPLLGEPAIIGFDDTGMP